MKPQSQMSINFFFLLTQLTYKNHLIIRNLWKPWTGLWSLKVLGFTPDDSCPKNLIHERSLSSDFLPPTRKCRGFFLRQGPKQPARIPEKHYLIWIFSERKSAKNYLITEPLCSKESSWEILMGYILLCLLLSSSIITKRASVVTASWLGSHSFCSICLYLV